MNREQKAKRKFVEDDMKRGAAKKRQGTHTVVEVWRSDDGPRRFWLFGKRVGAFVQRTFPFSTFDIQEGFVIVRSQAGPNVEDVTITAIEKSMVREVWSVPHDLVEEPEEAEFTTTAGEEVES